MDLSPSLQETKSSSIRGSSLARRKCLRMLLRTCSSWLRLGMDRWWTIILSCCYSVCFGVSTFPSKIEKENQNADCLFASWSSDKIELVKSIVTRLHLAIEAALNQGKDEMDWPRMDVSEFFGSGPARKRDLPKVSSSTFLERVLFD